MIIYPIIADKLDYDAKFADLSIGATIHDVAQVFGAGFSIFEDTCEVVAVGMKTELQDIINVGLPEISLLVSETAFIGCFTNSDLSSI